MPDYAFAVPIVHGQEQHYRETFEELEGARRDEYEAALSEAGVRRLATWLLKGLRARSQSSTSTPTTKRAVSDSPLPKRRLTAGFANG
jgi:hypothetical protein